MTRTKTFYFGNVAYDGHVPARNQARVVLELRDTEKGPEVSICGEIWEPVGKRNRDLLSCGQNLDTMAEYLTGSPTFDTLYALWKRWHLNGMRSACEHQRARGETWTSHPSAECPDCGYKLGHAWLYEPIPADVMETLNRLLA